MKAALYSLFERDLQRLYKEIEAYENEQHLWAAPKNISNAAGNLALHLCGNLRHFIGAQLGNTGYVRDREAEFTRKDVPKSVLLEDIKTTGQTVLGVISSLQESVMDEIYPLEVMGKPMTTGYFLIHLSGHLNYHLGQINYHRRML